MTLKTILLSSAALAIAHAAPAFADDDDPKTVAAAPQDVIVTGERTERTDAYAAKAQSTATRLPLSQRETPQSVSIVTRAQIEDFQLNDVNALLTTVPGVNVQAQETDRVYYSARGFDIQTFQIDGVGLPFAFEVATGSIDTAIYDRIEVVRGAAGLLSSTGNPSAVVNFIRKRPSKTAQAGFDLQYGSFDSVRADADVSVPITRDGRVRARAVGVYQDGDSYLDRYHLRRWTGYGIVEADLGASTTVSAGYGHQDHQSNAAMWGALPLTYTDGTRIDLPRSTNTGPDWAGWHVTDRQIFGDITHDFGGGWVFKASAQRRAISEDDKLFYVYGNPVRGAPGGIHSADPADPNDAAQAIFSYPGAFKAETRNLTLDAYIGGPVELFGRKHDLMFGVNRSGQRYVQYSSYDYATVGVPLAVDGSAFDGSFPLPAFPSDYDLSLDIHTRRETAYGLVRLNIADPLKVMLGGNYTHATATGYSYGVANNFDRSRFLPFVGATLDLTPSLSAYASFATIFNPQTQLDVSYRILDPIEGDNLEAGFKGEWLNGKLNASIAVFQARQNNTATDAGFVVDPVTGVGRTVYVPVDAKSQGVELEFGGQLLPGLQATGGYTIMRIRGKADDGDDIEVRRFVPRNTARLNLSYAPPSLAAVKLGASFQYQSRIQSPTGIRQGGYALLDLLARYEVTDRLSLSANVRNVTNAKYLGALNYDAGFYGAPRTVLGTVSFRY